MTLDQYKETCAEVLAGPQPELCSGLDVFRVGEWSEEDRIALLRLYTLYGMASVHETADDDEPMPFFDHFWALPVKDEMKYTVLENARFISE